MTSLKMNDDLYEEGLPPYVRPIHESSSHNRSVSAQIQTSLPSTMLTRDRGKSAQPTTTALRSLYPSLSDADLLLVEHEPPTSECKSIEVYLKEIWEAGYGVHTGIFKKLSRIADNGKETSWRTVRLEWKNGQLVYHENSKTTLIPLKHSTFGIDKNYVAHPFILTIQQVNGKMIKFGFPNFEYFTCWQSFLIKQEKSL